MAGTSENVVQIDESYFHGKTKYNSGLQHPGDEKSVDFKLTKSEEKDNKR